MRAPEPDRYQPIIGRSVPIYSRYIESNSDVYDTQFFQRIYSNAMHCTNKNRNFKGFIAVK